MNLDLSSQFLPPDENTYQLSVLPSLLSPVSRGTITLKSNDPDEDPVIQPNYLSEPADVEVLIKAVKKAREIMSHYQGAESLAEDLLKGRTLNLEDDEGIEALIRHITLTCYHPGGTCKMGSENDPSAVVTPDLKVKGIRNLRVADASVMPVLVTSNPNATVMMIGEKAARMIRHPH